MSADKEQCKGCTFSFADPDSKSLHCRRFPPQVVVVPTVNPLSRQGGLSFASAFPTIAESAYCGEYRPRAMLVS